MERIVIPFICLMVSISLPINAQIISIKTVPVATGDQFLIFPSHNLGMGGVSIALDDVLADPFTNPARGAYIEETLFISSPMFYSVSMNGNFRGVGTTGSARTVPLGMLFDGEKEFGGILAAWQQLNVEQTATQPIFFDDVNFTRPSASSKLDQMDNLFLFATGGRRSANGKLAVGISTMAAKLNGLEGVRLLYGLRDRVNQDGDMFTFSAGMTAELTESSTLDVVVLHHRFRMDQRINDTRKEQDQTNGLGVSAGYVRELDDGWRLGGEVVGNWQWHPKIPNYDLMQIPRDPGNSSAYNFGVGIARQYGQLTFGLDVIYEPIRSHTWANAANGVPIIAPSGEPTGRFILPGEKTVENFFRFNNRVVRAGVRQTSETFDLQLGLNVHTIRYHLDQTNYEFQFDRSQNERWSEWTLNAGFGLKFTSLEIRYLGRLTLGTGRPGLEGIWWGGGGCQRCVLEDFSAARNFLVAPAGDLTLQEAKIITSQLSIHVPIGN